MAVKIIHGPKSRNLQAVGLTMGEREQGLNSFILSYEKSDDRGTETDFIPPEMMVTLPFPSQFEKLSLAGKLRGIIRLGYRLATDWGQLKRLVEEFHVFNFYAGYSLIPIPLRMGLLNGLKYRDLPYLHRRGKKIFFHFQGCDLRTREDALTDDSGLKCCDQCSIRESYCSSLNIKIRKKILKERIYPYLSGVVVTTPDLKLIYPEAYVIPKSHVDTAFLNAEGKNYPRSFSERPLRIIHAPSNPEIKGTTHIETAVASLLAEGYSVELILPQNLPRPKVMAMAKEADIAIDQLLVGWYGGFAVEMMSLGLPTLAYLNKRAESLWPYAKPPVVNCQAHTLKDILKELLGDTMRLKKLSREGISYVREVHDRKKLADRMLALYLDAGIEV